LPALYSNKTALSSGDDKKAGFYIEIFTPFRLSFYRFCGKIGKNKGKPLGELYGLA
jgi:hypothetical protein